MIEEELAECLLHIFGVEAKLKSSVSAEIFEAEVPLGSSQRVIREGERLLGAPMTLSILPNDYKDAPNVSVHNTSERFLRSFA